MSRVSRITRPPRLGRLRLASADDAPAIMGIITDSMARNFRITKAKDIVYLIDNCVLTIVQLDVHDTIVGCLSVRDYPPVAAVHPCAWEDYIWTKFKAVELNPRNTLFLHLFCWNSLYARDIVDSMLKSVFMHDAYVTQIVMVKSLPDYPLLVPGQSRSEASFRRLTVLEKGVPSDLLPALCIADRKEVCPRLRIRRAVEEDNDDIVPIIEAHSARLQELYGEFYVSELISRHPESQRVLLVCEHKELAVGVMCLNTQINYEALEENFDLTPFIGLRKPDQGHSRTRNKDQDSFASQSSTCVECLESQSKIVSGSMSKDVKSKVTWTLDNEESTASLILGDSYPATQLDILNLLEDEEEIEFDIININTDLLRVPQMLYKTFDEGPEEKINKMLEERLKETIDDKKKDKKSGTMKPIEYPKGNTFSGTPNAFLLELFAMNHDYDERYGFDMLEAAFDLFPDRDYCIICLPSQEPSFPLLEHFTQVTSFGSRLRFINETLYVTHINSVRGNISVRPGESYDLPGLCNIVEHSPRYQHLIDLFESSLYSHTLQCYVVLSEKQPVGMVVLGPLEDGTAIRTQYDLEPEPRRPGTDGMILAGVVSPVLEPHSRWILREMLRFTHYSTLFWICRLFAKGDASPQKNLMSLAGHMTPVHPRASIPNLSGNKDLDKIFQDVLSPFSLWVLERPLSSLPKVYVNNSIVVVGASRTGLAFLEALFLGPTSQYLTFSNVTLVSEHGLPTVSECLRAADICVPRDGRYSDRYLKSVPFYFYLDVMSAVMVAIDRKKKCIHLKGGGVKYYDELVLTCGHQFQHPDYLRESLELVKEVERGKPCDRMLMDNPEYQPDRVPPAPDIPDNLMLINSIYQANVCLTKLLFMINEAENSNLALSGDRQVIVYGDCIEAYSCIAALLELDLEPDMITFVEPFPPEDTAKLRVNCFNNETVDERVQAKLTKLGIRIHRSYYLASWDTIGSTIKTVHLLSQLYAVSLPCFALFYYGIKAIDINAFKAINESGLVYDGGLVVSPSFETNDSFVYGAGTCTKYSRRLYANPRAHQYFCSEDVGEALAKLYLRRLDPFVMGTEVGEDPLPRFSSSIIFRDSQQSTSSLGNITTNCRKWQPVLRFESPIVQSTTLPGPLYYMKLRKPGVEIPMEVQMSLPHQGHTLITDKRGNLFRLQLNVLHCVEAVTCLSHKPFSSEIMAQLYGKHEAFFNKLLTRFLMGQIDDFYEFFTQPWLAAEYQETFSGLLRDINDQDIGAVYDMVKSRFNIYETGIKSSAPTYSAKSTTDSRKLGTFRSVLDRFVGRASSMHMAQEALDIPSECGQSQFIRDEALSFWKSIGGENLVITHLGKYLNRNNVTHPHYALPVNED